MNEEIKKDFHKRWNKFWEGIIMYAAVSILFFLTEKIFGRINLVYYFFIASTIVIINFIIFYVIYMGIFSIKNKIAFITPHTLLSGQEHCGWQAILTGIFTLIIGLLLFGLEIYLIINLL